MRRLGIVVGAFLCLAVVGAAAWGVVGGLRPAAPGGADRAAPGAAQGAQGDDGGVHGGPIERFHRAGPCDLVHVSGLPGNWTHGDYVAAVAASGGPELVRQAAHSDCGKPVVAVDKGGGPPAHALENMAAAQERAEEAEDPTQARSPIGS